MAYNCNDIDKEFMISATLDHILERCHECNYIIVK